jgi:co-chaperonin GroES (HSP10)
MAQAIQMARDADPKAEILSEVGPFLPNVVVLGARLLVAVYVRAERTAGGILLPGQTRGEDKYQGKVGLVLAAGSLAFQSDETHRFGGVTPQMGDWVVFSVGDTFAFELGKQRCRAVEDVDVHMILSRPDIIL